MKNKIIFSVIISTIIGVAFTSFSINNSKSIYAMALENIEALANDTESGGTVQTGTCYTYYVLGSKDIYGCQGQTDDTPKKCSKVALARGYDDYKKTCIK